MKTTRSRILLGAVLCCAVFGTVSASADVVGWWRFNGEGANVPNVAHPGTLDGTIVSISNDTSNAVADPAVVSFGSVASKMPTVTERLQGLAPRVYDPLDGSVMGGGKTLSWTKSFVQGGMMVPYSAALALDSFTIQAMIRLPNDAGSRGGYGGSMFPIAQFGKDQTEGWIFGVYEGYLFSRFTYTKTDGTVVKDGKAIPEYYAKASGFPSLYDGKWHHVAMVFTTAGVNAVCRMFVDGVQYAENRATNWKSWNYSGALPLFVGANPYTYARTFYGDIAEVRITDDATSKDQNNNFLVPLLDGQGLADADTALLLTFDNVAAFGFPTNATIATKQDASTSDTHANKAYRWYAKNWNILNAAYNAPTIPHWITFTNKSDTAILERSLWPTNSADTAGDLVNYASSGTTNAILDTGSLAIPTRPTVTSGGNTRTFSDLVQLDSSACYLSTNSFTAECFFKIDGDKTGTYTIFYAPFMKLCVNKGNLLLRGYINGSESSSGIGDITGTESVTNGAWHHVACVYDASTKTLTLWQDRGEVGSKSGTALYSGGYQTKSGITTLGFLIGGQRFDPSAALSSYTSDMQGFPGTLDMVRITRRALSKDEFLRSENQPSPLFLANFEDAGVSSISTGLPDCLAPAGECATRVDGGTLPSFAPSRAGRVAADGGDGTPSSNMGQALAFDGTGGYAIWPRNRLLERRSFTLEFFAKFPQLPNAATFARLNIGDGVGSPVWALYNNIATGDGKSRLYAVITTTSDGGVTFDRGSDLALYNLTDHAGECTGWHHWAMTVEQQETRVEVKLYKDGVNVTSGTQQRKNGQLYLPPEGTCLTFGASTASGAYLKGLFDNVRITAGVLDPSEFMQYEPAPFTFILR